MTGKRLDNRAAGQRIVQLVMLLVMCVATVIPAHTLASPVESLPAIGAANQVTDVPERNPTPGVRIEDPARILTAQQFQVLNADLDRLARLGTESVVFVRDSNDSSTSQSYLADDLRIAWGVESSVGARNGLVLVVSIDRDDPTQSTMVTSSGLHTFPIRQLTAEGFSHLVDTVALPQIHQGDVFGGLRDLAEFTLGTVIDRTGSLTERQITTLDGDLRRLNELGLPTLVYLRERDDQTNDDQAFAEEILNAWTTDTAEDANDHQVVLLTVDEDDPANSTIVYAAGADAYPIRQLTAEGYQAILDDEALPPLQEGDIYLSLAYAIRRAINYAEYSPPSPPALNEVQDFFQQPLNILAAVLVQVGLLLYVLIPAVLERKLTLIPSPRSMTIYTLGTAALAILVGVLGVLDRNRAASLAALGVFLLATVVLPLFRAGLKSVQDRLVIRRSRRAQPEEVAHAA